MDQLEILRKMSGEKRLEQACYLSDLVRHLTLLNIKNQLGKKASKREIMRKYWERLKSLK